MEIVLLLSQQQSSIDQQMSLGPMALGWPTGTHSVQSAKRQTKPAFLCSFVQRNQSRRLSMDAVLEQFWTQTDEWWLMILPKYFQTVFHIFPGIQWLHLEGMWRWQSKTKVSSAYLNLLCNSLHLHCTNIKIIPPTCSRECEGCNPLSKTEHGPPQWTVVGNPLTGHRAYMYGPAGYSERIQLIVKSWCGWRNARGNVEWVIKIVNASSKVCLRGKCWGWNSDTNTWKLGFINSYGAVCLFFWLP